MESPMTKHANAMQIQPRIAFSRDDMPARWQLQ